MDTIQLPGLNFLKRGKVREIYDLNDKLLMIASDRISCFDVVLPTAIPSKGKILTKLSTFWFEFTKDIVPNHLITENRSRFSVIMITAPGMAGKFLASWQSM